MNKRVINMRTRVHFKNPEELKKYIISIPPET